MALLVSVQVVAGRANDIALIALVQRRLHVDSSYVS
eukprot:CAMPEP_0198369608 /NCGR_PEP_ID=MMETSP1450-20131203/156294_1 /TAXON_ID=753684 ORGANISM="Madagascaria erythrocladiodes, Strain CCMP3234" /NCGR_SAMPLE_ID=MMETSP1450 /ASSEMBLY_ACC=CAM_ASM_001115 /LENGTH=35 /DNA_ID= /DNA_START= /DNA_END= /DNA_ORIENTATION=